MDEKKIHNSEFQLKGIAENMRCNLLQKRSTGKETGCSKHTRHIAIEKDIFSELNRCIFQISLKYIKLVIPKILFVLVLCNFNFYFKITWLPPDGCFLEPTIPYQIDQYYFEALDKALDCYNSYDRIVLIRDFNSEDHKTCLGNFFYQQNLENIVNEATCFKNYSKPSTTDLFLTNNSSYFQNTKIFFTGFSDISKLVTNQFSKKQTFANEL